MSIQRLIRTKPLILYSPALLCLAIMLPRLISAQFGFFDDGKTLSIADQMVRGTWNWNWEFNPGRFRPVYRLFFTMPYALFGKQAFWYFFVNTILFVLVVVEAIVLVRRLGGSNVQAWTTGTLFAISGPVAENYYTISKGEPLQLLLLVGSLLVLTLFNIQQSRRQKISLVLGMAVILFAAHTTKETSLSMIPISLAWLGIAWGRMKLKHLPSHVPAYAAYLIANILAGITFLALRSAFITKSAGGSYVGNYQFGISRILASLIRWSGWLIRDYAYLIPLLIIAAIWCFRNRRLLQDELFLNTLIWMIAWMCIFLPWQYTVEYYMLAFALGTAFLGGWLVSLVLGETLSARQKKWTRIFSSVGMAISALLLLITLFDNYSSARIQLAVDAANNNMFEYMIQHIPEGGTLWINIQTSNEYVEQLSLLKDVWGRTDVQVKLFHNNVIPGANDFIVTPNVTNQPLLTVRMGIIAANQNPWNRDLRNYFSAHSGWRQVYKANQHFRLMIVDLPRLLCPVMQGRSFCTASAPILNTRIFTYGWQIYQLETP